MNNPKPIRVYIAEDKKFELDVTDRLFKAYPEVVEVVGKSDSLQNAIDEICSMEPKPEVVLMDIDFRRNDMDGISALETVKQRNRKVRFIMFTAYDTPELPALAFRLGAEGFLYRGESTVERLVNAIRSVHSGLPVWDHEAFQKAQEWKLNLKPIERRLLVELARDPGTNSEVAQRVSIGVRAVEGHLQNVMDALNIHRRDQLIVWARDNLRLIP